MIRLVSELAEARDRVDRAIALGGAIPRLEKLRRTIIVGLIGACLILSAGYIHMNQEISTIEHNQEKAKAARLRAESERQKMQKMLRDLLGREGAEVQPTSRSQSEGSL